MPLSPQEIAAVEPRLLNREWRLNNLYHIVDEHGKDQLFKMRPAQKKLYKERHWRNILLKARQLGMTTFVDLFGLDLAIWNRNIRGGIVAHTREDAAVIFRDKIKYAYEHLPDFIREWFPAEKNDAGELLLANNSSMRVGTGFRSATAQFLHLSEYAAICARYPKKASEIKTGSIPAVHEGGFIFIESTAKGNEGDFYDMCMNSQRTTLAGRELSPLSFKFHFFPWYDCDTYRSDPERVIIPARLTEYFDKQEIALGLKFDPCQRAWYAETEATLGGEMKSEHPTTAEEAFESSIEGAYYRTQLDKAFADERVGEFSLAPELPDHTAWDIGRDTTSIWFFQDLRGEIRLIDYYENSGEEMEFYVGVLRDRGYNYGTHIGPHDLGVKEFTASRTRLETAASKYGLRFVIAPSVGVADGIEIVRQTLRRCWFWESKVEQGLKGLSNYKKDWNDDKGCWMSTPRHDWASHPADSFRYLCLGWKPGLASAPKKSAKWGY